MSLVGYASVFARAVWLKSLIGFTILDIFVVKPLAQLALEFGSKFIVWVVVGLGTF
jgi:hypothetical protein